MYTLVDVQASSSVLYAERIQMGLLTTLEGELSFQRIVRLLTVFFIFLIKSKNTPFFVFFFFGLEFCVRFFFNALVDDFY